MHIVGSRAKFNKKKSSYLHMHLEKKNHNFFLIFFLTASPCLIFNRHKKNFQNAYPWFWL